jgi:hypothetical protein
MGLFDGIFSSAVDAASSLVGGEEIVQLAGDAAGVATGGIPWGSLAMAGAGYLGQSGANASNMQIAQNQMNFQKEMSNTSYQRAVEDMKKAGLNPMLAYSQGGASTPQGATTRVESKTAGAIQAAQQAQQIQSNVDLQRTQSTLNGAAAAREIASADNLRAETINKLVQTDAIRAATQRDLATAGESGQRTKLLTAQTSAAEPAAAFAREYPNLSKWIHGIGSALKPAASAASTVRSLK